MQQSCAVVVAQVEKLRQEKLRLAAELRQKKAALKAKVAQKPGAGAAANGSGALVASTGVQVLRVVHVHAAACPEPSLAQQL